VLQLEVFVSELSTVDAFAASTVTASEVTTYRPLLVKKHERFYGTDQLISLP
jgi:hypothetical protein